MDKNNYNVEDILSEIKSRKSRNKIDMRSTENKPNPPAPESRPAAVLPPEPPVQRRPSPQVPQQPIVFDDSDPEPRGQPRAPAPQRPQPKQRVNPADAETFKVTIPDDIPEVKKNPLEFSGNVRSIDERAKVRNAGGTRQLPKFDFNVSGAPDAEALGDDGHTRVLPNVSGMREIKARTPRRPVAKRETESSTSYYDEPDDGIEVTSGDYSEYNSASDRHDVHTDIARVKLWLFIRISSTIILTLILFMFTMWGKYENVPLLPKSLEPVSETMRAYLLACTVLAILVALINSSTVGGGLIGLFKMHANSDTLPACAALGAVAQGVLLVANPEAAEPDRFNLYFIIAAVIMLFNGLGKILMINRIMLNFRTISTDTSKKALLTVRSDEFCREFFKNEVRRPVIAYSAKTGFFTDFLGLSYSDRYDVGINRVIAPVCILASAVVGVLTYILAESAVLAVSSITAVLCVCATLSSTFIENLPLWGIAKKLEPMGGIVSGIRAVEDFCGAKAVILTENDLFPAGNVHIHEIKAFTKRIDEGLLDAASALSAMDGALGNVFLDMIKGNKQLLKRVDNVVFENDMGISAWVDQRRVLIGNRKLMMNHGISLPPEAMRQHVGSQISADSEPLFLSTAGEAVAQFSVSYHIDEDLALELDHLGSMGKLLIVYTTDANITAEKIWELYGYPLERIRVLPAEMHASYQEMSKPRDKAPAEIAFTGKAAAVVKAVISCISAKGSIVLATNIQLFGIALGYAFVTYMALMGTIGSLNIAVIAAYQLFFFAAVFVAQKVRQAG